MTPAEAARTIRDLFARHGISDRDQAKRLVRERFTQDELDAYKEALEVLDGMGVIG
ncbi:hypothetical protein [Ornithinimicrobium sp. W1665]|uniref:hypothetical protein n=1 Tax=Ornithinimicrobium sp. W1665 TaxID=3416666 RepID=UPI003CF192CD